MGTKLEANVRRLERHGIGVFGAVLLILPMAGVPALAQYGAPAPVAPQQAPPAQLLTPEQLDNLVAPIALYPDPLLSQVLVASTYPLEIVEASQWVQEARGLQGPQLAEAARQQNWDPSVQALVVFPDVLGRLSSNISWTTDLGNAFLAQQGDVMSAVQRMRARAEAAGRLTSDAEQTVTTETEDGQTAIEIVPANPQVIYVPEYNPEYIWGPPAWGYYPSLYYPGAGFGLGFDSGIFLGAYFGGWGGSGWGGWGGWGWGPNWFGRTILTNGYFFNRYGFRGYYGGGYGRGGVWAHNPYHRMGIPYPTRGLASRFGGYYGGQRGVYGGQRGVYGGQRGAYGGQGGAGFGGSRTGGSYNTRGGIMGGQRGAYGFQGNSRGFAGQTNGGGWQRFGGNNSAPRAGGFAGSRYNSGPSYRGPAASTGQRFSGYNGSPTMRGGSAPAFRQMPAYGGGRSFGGGSRSYSGNGGSRSFSAPRSFGGGGSPSFSGGGSRSFSGGGSRSFGGGGSRSFGGGGSRSFGGGGSRSFGGGGSRSFGGGGGHSVGGGGSHGGGGHGRR